MTETLTKIWNSLKSIQGIVVSSVAIIAIGSSVLLRHDAKVIKSYVDSTQVKSNVRFTLIENSIVDLKESVNTFVGVSNGNFTTVKSELTSHIQKSGDIKPDARIEAILKVTNGINTNIENLLIEVKKKY